MAGYMTPKEEKKPVITSGTVNIGPAIDFPAGTANTRLKSLHSTALSS